jgi:type 1 fimbriae regulatory protein FimB
MPKNRASNEVKYLSEEEIRRLFSAIRDPRDTAMFRLAYHRGLRASEIGLLDVSDYRQQSDRLYVRRRKGSSSGEFHLTKNEVRALRAWLRVRGTAPGPLFLSREGNGISRQMLDVLIKKYGAAAGIPAERRHMHVLKHSCGTHLLERGEPLEDVQDHLGHVNIQNTLIYARITNPRRQARDRRLRDW